jgi:hypothetical protein
VLFANGNRFGGHSLYVKEGTLKGTVALSDRVVILDLAAGDGTRSQPFLPWSSVSDARHKTAGSAPRPQAVA